MTTFTAIATALLGPLLFGVDEDGVVVQRRVETMGTVLWVEVEAPDRAQGLKASEKALQAVEAARKRLSTWTTESELSRFLACEVGEELELSALLSQELSAARRLSDLTGGAFDPSVGALSRAWGLRSGGRMPSALELERAKAASGAKLWELEGRVAVRRHASLSIDEGGFGKGAALVQALAALDEAGVGDASLNLGGQLAFLGDAQRVVPIADPDERGTSLVEIQVNGGSVATSANTERAGHLLDPRTGQPAADFGSVTVWAQDALTADALSTGLFALGPEAGLELVERLAGVEAVFIEATSPQPRIRVSEGLRKRTRLLFPCASQGLTTTPDGRTITTH